jgi:hypothetical protein
MIREHLQKRFGRIVIFSFGVSFLIVGIMMWHDNSSYDLDFTYDDI